MKKLTINTIDAYTLNENEEIVFAYHWNNDYGMRNGEIKRIPYNAIEEAENKYKEMKRGNGGYVTGWFEVRERGELNRMEELKKEIERLEKELKELEG